MEPTQFKRQVASLFQNIKLRRKRTLENKETVKDALPPFLASQVVLSDRLRVFRTLTILCAVGLSVAIGYILTEDKRKEIIVVPGVPNVMRVRAGSIPDEVIYSFAEHVSRQLGTFSYRSVERQYKEVSDLMSPEFRHRFLFNSEKQFPLYQELRVDEIFEFDPVSKFTLKNTSKGAKYEVQVTGSTKKYVEGTLRETNAEIFVIEFQTTPLRGDRPWLLEVTNFRRSTAEEEANLNRAAAIPSQ